MRSIATIVFLISFVLIARSQNILSNESALISITEGVTVTVQGNATNNGVLVNEGELRLVGDWINSGDYSSVSGTFTTEGDDSMFEPGNEAYEHLVLGAASTQITSDLVVEGELTINGVLNFSSNTGLFLNENATLKGGNENAYINGVLYSSQQGDLLFPVGTETEYLPVQLLNVQSIEPVGVSATNGELLARIGATLAEVSLKRYWEVLGSEGFSASGIVLPVSNETFIDASGNEPTIAFTLGESDPLMPLTNSTLSGSATNGSIRSDVPIQSGFFLIATAEGIEPPITVVNVVTPLQDGKHDFLRIENIEFFSDNKVEVFDRQGNKVFELSGYNNTDRVFRGSSNVGNRGQLDTGSYFYTVRAGNNRKSGFLYIKN